MNGKPLFKRNFVLAQISETTWCKMVPKLIRSNYYSQKQYSLVNIKVTQSELIIKPIGGPLGIFFNWILCYDLNHNIPHSNIITADFDIDLSRNTDLYRYNRVVVLFYDKFGAERKFALTMNLKTREEFVRILKNLIKA